MRSDGESNIDIQGEVVALPCVTLYLPDLTSRLRDQRTLYRRVHLTSHSVESSTHSASHVTKIFPQKTNEWMSVSQLPYKLHKTFTRNRNSRADNHCIKCNRKWYFDLDYLHLHILWITDTHRPIGSISCGYMVVYTTFRYIIFNSSRISLFFLLSKIVQPRVLLKKI